MKLTVDNNYAKTCMRGTRLERLTVWSTLNFQHCSTRHVTGNDVSRATTGIANTETISKATILSNTTIKSKVTVATM